MDQRYEMDLLLLAVKDKYGYDFTGYKYASLERRLSLYLNSSEKEHYSELIPDLLHDPGKFEILLNTLTINITEMFRDPPIYQVIRNDIIPWLATFPRINIWSAGCSSGQEAYSIAIILHESGLYSRTKIYGTDINSSILKTARNGIFKEADFKIYSKSYIDAGCKSSLSDYFYLNYGNSLIHDSVKSNISFFNHNLVTDDSFIEAQLIICSNVLIYFNTVLQNRVWNLFYNSLHSYGFLVLGNKEKIPEQMLGRMFEKISANLPVYRKVPRG